MQKFRVVVAVASVGSALALAACGSVSTSAVAATPGSSAAATPTSGQPVTKTKPAVKKAKVTPKPATVAHVGSTIAVSVETPSLDDGTADVTLVKVIDPAKGSDEFTVADNGTRYVGAKFEIKALELVDDDANDDANLVGSNGQTYTADFDSIAGCTNFASGEFKLAKGGESTGCVTFQVPTGVTVKQITFGTEEGTTGQWKV